MSSNHVDSNIADRNAAAIGHAIAKLLHLRKREGRYRTIWGTFTELGLGNVVLRIISEVDNAWDGTASSEVINLLPPAPDVNKVLKSDPVNCSRGASMGQTDAFDPDAGWLYLGRVKMVDGDYSPDGTYWGGGSGTLPLWCAINGGISPGKHSRIWVRAKSRQDAVRQIMEHHMVQGFFGAREDFTVGDVFAPNQPEDNF